MAAHPSRALGGWRRVVDWVGVLVALTLIWGVVEQLVRFELVSFFALLMLLPVPMVGRLWFLLPSGKMERPSIWDCFFESMALLCVMSCES